MEASSKTERQRVESLSIPRRIPGLVKDYIALTKPRVISLLLWTTVTAMFVAGRPSLVVVIATVIGGYLAAGGAGAINHFIDRDIDGDMGRTSARPIPAGRIHPAAALWFGVALGAVSFSVFVLFVNLAAAILAMVGLLFYVLVYSAWLKRTTPQNIVIGGAAGAIPPLVGWAATTGSLDLASIYLFAIVFYWTPPHFWSLALLIKDEYAKTNVPMLPVVRGERETVRQIFLYTLLLLAVTLLPVMGGLFGAVYLGAALLLGGIFVYLSVGLLRHSDRRKAAIFFHYSLIYLALLFAAMVVDKWV